VADRIVHDIAALGWPEGAVFGSEPELLERYCVSRAVFREAVRLVEHQHVARMRRGPGGGLVVTAANVESVIDAAAVYLFSVDARLDEVLEARLVLEQTVADLAPVRRTDHDEVLLRSLGQRERDGITEGHRELHALLASITGNPALEFFVDLMNRFMDLYGPGPPSIGRSTKADSAHAHLAIIDSVLAGDSERARRQMTKHLVAEADYVRSHRSSRQRLNINLRPDSAKRNKRAEGLSREIFADILAAGWPMGHFLGSEPELMKRHEVSRAVLRESVRLLEHHQLASMRRGPGGGLYVTKPGIDAITEAVAIHLERTSIERTQLFEARIAVEMAIVDLVVERLDADGAAQLKMALEKERTVDSHDFPIVGHDLHAVLAHVSGNRVLELLSLVIVRLSQARTTVVPKGAGPNPPGDVMRAHEGLVTAILAGDAELSRRRARRHLEALTPWVR
jgi:DNA-binding FadR family transcriptional regulator